MDLSTQVQEKAKAWLPKKEIDGRVASAIPFFSDSKVLKARIEFWQVKQPEREKRKDIAFTLFMCAMVWTCVVVLAVLIFAVAESSSLIAA